MSKLFDKYNKLKKANPNKYYLFKSGIFYIFLDNDAKFMSNILQLKLTNFTPELVKCGFPINSLNKYMNIFKTLNYDVEIVNNSTNNKSSFSNQIEVEKFIKEIANVNTNLLSVSEAYSFINKIKAQANILL